MRLLSLFAFCCALAAIVVGIVNRNVVTAGFGIAALGFAVWGWLER